MRHWKLFFQSMVWPWPDKICNDQKRMQWMQKNLEISKDNAPTVAAPRARSERKASEAEEIVELA